MRCHSVARAAAVFATAIAAASAATALAPGADNAAGTTQIFQQRTSDGRILLTDRPYPDATTLRAWQLEREDPVAARERALDMQREAQAVSTRVQLGIERQQRQLAEAFAARQPSAPRDAVPVGLGDVAADEILVTGSAYPFFFADRGRYGNRFANRFDARIDGRYARPSEQRFDGRIGSPPRRDPPLPRPRLKGSAEPESR